MESKNNILKNELNNFIKFLDDKYGKYYKSKDLIENFYYGIE